VYDYSQRQSEANMSFMVRVYSKIYMNDEDTSWSARPNQRLLQLLHDLNDSEGSARWIALVGDIRIALGDPVQIEDSRQCTMFLPQWIIDSSGFEGDGQEVEIEFERSESLPKATRLGFKIIGDIPRDMDIKELLEEPLSQLGVLQEGQMIPAPVLEGVCLLVQTYQDGPVFLDGAEIALEIEEEEPVAYAPVASAAESKEDEAEAKEAEADDFSMFASPPVSVAPISNGKTAFVPFQGVGRRLCD